MRKRLHSGPGLLLGMALLACGDVTDSPDSTVRRDSAGVEIVENSVPSWDAATAWTLSAEPSLTVGEVGGDPDYLLDRVTGATRMQDGRVVVSERGTNTIRFFDPEGRLLDAIGGEGDGPGEFQWIRALGRCGGDSIYAFDLSWPMTVYDSEGEFQREVLMFDPTGQVTPYQLACSRTGRFAAVGWGNLQGPPIIGLYDAMAPLFLMDSDGNVSFELGEVLSSERLGTSGGSRPHPFGKAVRFALGPDALYVGDGRTFEIRELGLDGTLRRLIRGPAVDLTLTDEIIATYRRAELDEFGEGDRQALERSLSDMPFPDTYPAFDALILDSDGHIWAKSFRLPDSAAAPWWVFAPDGTLLGSIAIPDHVEVLEIGADYILGLTADDLGVQRVVMYDLMRSG